MDRTEVGNLEKWIKETPEILSEEIIIIGEQVEIFSLFFE